MPVWALSLSPSWNNSAAITPAHLPALWISLCSLAVCGAPVVSVCLYHLAFLLSFVLLSFFFFFWYLMVFVTGHGGCLCLQEIADNLQQLWCAIIQQIHLLNDNGFVDKPIQLASETNGSSKRAASQTPGLSLSFVLSLSLIPYISFYLSKWEDGCVPVFGTEREGQSSGRSVVNESWMSSVCVWSCVMLINGSFSHRLPGNGSRAIIAWLWPMPRQTGLPAWPG